jgi:two-component system sensor histidine kinase DesK
MAEAGYGAPGGANDAWVFEQNRWARGWRRVVFPSVFLVYLVAVAGAIAQYSHGPAEIIGFIALGAFCTVYIGAVAHTWVGPAKPFWTFFAAGVGLFLIVLPIARANAFIMCVFLVVLLVARLHGRSAPYVAGLTLLAVFVPVLVPSWHDGISTALDNGTAITIPLVGLAMFGFFSVMRGNHALAEARAELAGLAAENERFRIARDLHDLLGHSLTTITVKAALARRLGASDPAGAMTEIEEVERLSRRALADVRAAVANYREVSLAGELATGRELLRAAGIAAELPRAVDGVDERAQELFGWVVKEGLTNVVRHSHATTCSIRLGSGSIEILDDGVGAASGTTNRGTGLSGLEERVEHAGGVLETGPVEPSGWRVCARLAPQGATI